MTPKVVLAHTRAHMGERYEVALKLPGDCESTEVLETTIQSSYRLYTLGTRLEIILGKRLACIKGLKSTYPI